jgi:hypothetical protein
VCQCHGTVGEGQLRQPASDEDLQALQVYFGAIGAVVVLAGIGLWAVSPAIKRKMLGVS